MTRRVLFSRLISLTFFLIAAAALAGCRNGQSVLLVSDPAYQVILNDAGVSEESFRELGKEVDVSARMIVVDTLSGGTSTAKGETASGRDEALELADDSRFKKPLDNIRRQLSDGGFVVLSPMISAQVGSVMSNVSGNTYEAEVYPFLTGLAYLVVRNPGQFAVWIQEHLRGDRTENPYNGLGLYTLRRDFTAGWEQAGYEAGRLDALLATANGESGKTGEQDPEWFYNTVLLYLDDSFYAELIRDIFADGYQQAGMAPETTISFPLEKESSYREQQGALELIRESGAQRVGIYAGAQTPDILKLLEEDEVQVFGESIGAVIPEGDSSRIWGSIIDPLYGFYRELLELFAGADVVQGESSRSYELVCPSRFVIHE